MYLRKLEKETSIEKTAEKIVPCESIPPFEAHPLLRVVSPVSCGSESGARLTKKGTNQKNAERKERKNDMKKTK